MTDLEMLARVRLLRAEGNAPKQIARILGLSPSVVAPLVRAVAAERDETAVAPPVVGCWVNQGWSLGLSVDPAQGWQDQTNDDDSTAGLVCVLLARRHRFDKVMVCGYLADVYCLGIKNTFGPEVMGEFEFSKFQPEFFGAFQGWQTADIELARHLIFGAVDYARALGFEPQGEFDEAAGLLGPWTGPSAITFGKDGKPSYVSGPYDDPRRILKTLERTAAGQFEFSVAADH